MKNLIIKFLNLEPSQVLNIDVISEGDQVFTIITLIRQFFSCPFCHLPTNRIHDYRQRTLSHAILNGITTTLVYNQRRYYCSHCKKSFPEENPFVNSGKRISRYTLLRIMKELKNPRMTFSMVAANCNLSISTVIRVFDDYAGIPSLPFPDILCIDEVYALKYNQKVYACVLLDFRTNEIFDLLPSRHKYQLANYFSKIDKAQRDKVLYISMDMWEPYRDVTSLYFKNAKICVDNFHVVKLINYAFSKVRIRVMSHYDKGSDNYYLLKKYAWLLNMKYDDIHIDKKIKLYKKISSFYHKDVLATKLINHMLDCDYELEIAYMLKEEFNEINKQATAETIASKLDTFIENLMIYNLNEFKTITVTLKKWRQEIINSFDLIEGRRISNGPVESLNSRIKCIKRNANGYQNFDRFRRRVLYSLSSKSYIHFH